MKLKEIIEDADLLAPNSFSIERKIGWINQTQRAVYQDYPTLLTMKEIPLASGASTIPLPADCTQSSIEALFINEYEYLFQEVAERPEFRTYTIYDGSISVNPAAQSDMTAKLYYKPVPVDLTMNDLALTPTFPENYHELLVLGCAYRMAQRSQDFKVSAEIEIRYQGMAREAAKNITRPKQKTVTRARGWR